MRAAVRGWTIAGALALLVGLPVPARAAAEDPAARVPAPAPSAAADDAGGMMGGPPPAPPTGEVMAPSRRDAGPPPTGAGRLDLPGGLGPPLDTPLERRRMARALYFDLRGRGPSTGELRWAAAISHEAQVDAMLADPATYETWLEHELYHQLLLDRFRPAGERLRALPAQLAAGTATAHDALREVVFTPEFNARNPGNDTFVTVVLESLLAIRVQDHAHAKTLEAGKKMYDGLPARMWGILGRSQSDCLRIVLGRPEVSAQLVRRAWRQVHGEEPPDAVVQDAGARLRADPSCLKALFREWLLDPAWKRCALRPRPKDDAPYIRTLFVDLLGRTPDFEEFRNMRNALLALSDPAPVRRVLAQLLLESPGGPRWKKEEIKAPEDWVRERFLLLLGREPTARERDAFVAELGTYAGKPETLVLALLTSPDYQYH
jgi:hypothetical protein